MSLARFIKENSAAIIEEFESFARTHTHAGEWMSGDALREHAASMLSTIAMDLEGAQSGADEALKSRGDAASLVGAPETAAELHGSDRAHRGFSLQEMFSEYRALRASVLRLRMAAGGQLDEVDVRDLIRFNEAIDQSIAESISRFSTGIEHSREMFLAILGHDLRNPLGAILGASDFLVTESSLSGRDRTMAVAIKRSATRMEGLVRDLLDFTRSRLGQGITITRTRVDLSDVVREAVEEFTTTRSDRDVLFEQEGDVSGDWDGNRVSQAVSNLIGNAFQHGAKGRPITVGVKGSELEVVIAVHNEGSPIPREDQLQIFDPYGRVTTPGSVVEVQGSMGLGLYIAQEIASAHTGWVDLESSHEGGTVFQLHLPRHGEEHGAAILDDPRPRLDS